MRSLVIVVFTTWIIPLQIFPQQQGRSPDTLAISWETHLLPMTTTSMDAPIDQVVDVLGNLYVTGKSEGRESGYDYFTIKYNNSGQLQWTARYDGNAHGADIPNAIAVDHSGNVYVTGMSIDSDSTFDDIITIKYSSGGQRLWVAHYNGPGSVTWSGNGTDAPSDLVVDPTGNVYVAGFQTGEWFHDFVTICYNPQGIEQWVAVYGGPAGGNDEARAIALDQSGYIYVTGASDDSSLYDYHRDCVTIKYDQSGNVIWVQRYTGPQGFEMAPVGMSIDGNGNICVAANQTYLSSYPDIISKHDILTLKYAPDGELLWARIFTSPNYEESPIDILDLATGIAIDAASNIYVTGVSGRGWYYQTYDSLVTIKYFPDGSKHWARYYVSTGDAIRSAGITVDPSGKIHVTGSNMHLSPAWYSTGEYLVGYDVVALQYNSDRVLEWTQSIETLNDTMMAAKGICSDGAGNVYIIAEHGIPDDLDYASFKISPSGSQVWSTSTNGPGSSIAFIADAKVDQQGNIYVTGSGVGKGSNQDYTTMKMAPNGAILWSATYDSPDHFGDYPRAIDVDQSGNVYVTGLISQGPYGWSSSTIKYGPAGNQEWVARFDSSAMSVIAVDLEGNVYVGGLGIVKYSPNGVQQWHFLPSPYDWVNALAVGDSGCILATTSSYPTGKLRKFSPDGALMWSTTVPSPGGLALDDSGYIYVSAPTYDPGTGGTKKFSPSGTEQWSIVQGGNKIVSLGQIAVYALSGITNPKFLYKIGTDGSLQWTKNIASDSPVDFDIDNDGSAYATSRHYDDPNASVTTTKYAPDGEIEWSSQYESMAPATFRATKVRIDASANVYIFPEKDGADFSTTPVVAKNNQIHIISSTDEEKPLPQHTRLSQNYPNPFNPTTVISYQLTVASQVSLKVYNVLGQEVVTLVDGRREAGDWSQEWKANGVASGMYFYRLTARALNNGEVFVSTKKMLLVK